MNWQRLFTDYILDRGYDYYCDNAVSDLKRKNNVITATVSGTEDYDVEITFHGEKITDMYCSCPYADDGKNCKHMAAVLFELEDEKCDEDYDKQKIRFKNLVRPGVYGGDMKYYKKQIDKIVRKNQGIDGFIDYYEASNFVCDLEEFLDEDVRMILDGKNFKEAFELTNYIFITAGNVDIDDSDGGISYIADKCCGIWEKILENCDISVKKTMYSWFTSHLDGSIIDYMEEYIERILVESFKEKEFIAEKLAFTDRKVKEAEKISDSWSKEYNAGNWALRHLTLMEDDKKTWSELEAYCKEHWNPSSVRNYYIDKCMKQKNYNRAIEVLIESRKIDKNYPGLIKDHSYKLKEIYQLSGKKKEYIEQLWLLILNDDAGNLDIYKELKEQYPEKEWVTQREKIFRELPAYAHAEALYKEDKLYSRLLEYVKQSPGLYALKEYENVLKKDYSHEILEKYAEEVEKMASRTSDRKHYQELVFILRKMSRLSGGKQKVNEIASRWRIAYCNRRAMMDELSKL